MGRRRSADLTLNRPVLQSGAKTGPEFCEGRFVGMSLRLLVL